MLTENRFGFVYLKEEVLQIADAQIKLESPNALKPYFDYFEEK
jgi:ATP-dependent DNA helicase RecQ